MSTRKQQLKDLDKQHLDQRERSMQETIKVVRKFLTTGIFNKVRGISDEQWQQAANNTEAGPET